MAYSKEWLNLFYYKKNGEDIYKSSVDQEDFFLDKNGKTSPLKELKTTLNLFQGSDGDKNHKEILSKIKDVTFDSQVPLYCYFPARFKILKKSFFKTIHQEMDLKRCTELKSWLETIRAKELYIVYASVYANNPASMFGHTMLRFGRGHHYLEESELNHYSIAFLAATMNDNPLAYTYKGLTGKYLGYFNIHPFYENLGPYNNIEGRDLHEYKLDFSEDEIETILFHLWEMGQGVGRGLPYYFLDENCSYYLLNLLQIGRENLDFKKDFPLVTIPSETVKWLKKEKLVEPYKIRYSLKKKIKDKFLLLDKREKSLFLNSIEENKISDSIQNKAVLDGLIDFWSYKNYKKKGELLQEEKMKREKVLLERSKIKSEVNEDKMTGIGSANDWVHLGHLPSRLKFGLSSDQQTYKENLNLKYSYGNHLLEDRSAGYDEYSYIHYFGFETNYDVEEKRVELNRLTLIDIHSLNPSYKLEQNLAWKAVSAFQTKSDNNLLLVEGGIGKSFEFGLQEKKRLMLFYLLLGPDLYIHLNNEKLRTKPLTLFLHSEIGFKTGVSEKGRFLLEHHLYYGSKSNFIDELQIKFLYDFIENLSLEMIFNKNILQYNRQRMKIYLGNIFYF